MFESYDNVKFTAPSFWEDGNFICSLILKIIPEASKSPAYASVISGRAT